MPKTLSVAIITWDAAPRLELVLASVCWAEEIIIVDSGGDRHVEELARSFNVRFFDEAWKGFASQKNSAIEKCSCDWILTLDDDEVVTGRLASEIPLLSEVDFDGYSIPRRTLFLSRWIRHGGFYPDPKLRLFRRGSAEFELRPVHKKLHFVGKRGKTKGAIEHIMPATLSAYIARMDRFSSLGAAGSAGALSMETGNLAGFVLGIFLRPAAMFCYNYFLRLGFLDGREGLLAHLYQALHASSRHARAWELARQEWQS